jgi:hypothetical protein
MARRQGNNIEGKDIHLFRLTTDGDEEALCDVTAAVWDRLSEPGRMRFLQAICEVAGVSLPPIGTAFTVRREHSFVDAAQQTRRRLDFLVRVEGWGVIGIEAKRSQAEWYASGPSKFPTYIREVGRHPGVSIMLALTPEPVEPRDLDRGDQLDVEVGSLTWRQLTEHAMSGDAEGRSTDWHLLKELRSTLEDAGLLTRLMEIDMTTLLRFQEAHQTLLETASSIDRFLELLGREAEHGLCEHERLGIQQAMLNGLDDSYVKNPYVIFKPTCWPALRTDAVLVVVVDIAHLLVHILAGYMISNAPDHPGPGAWPVTNCPADCRLFFWGDDGVDTFDLDANGANALALRSAGAADRDVHGLCRSITLEAPGKRFGSADLDRVRAELRRMAVDAGPLLRGGAPAHPAPSVDAILEVARHWGIDDLPRSAADAEREAEWGWRPEHLADLFYRRFTGVNGKWFGPKRKRGGWPEDLSVKLLYQGVDGAMCCGARISRPQSPARVTRCPFCNTSHKRADIEANQS